MRVLIAHGGFDLVLGSLIAISSLAYARGVVRLWRKAGTGRGIRIVDVVRFTLGMTALVAALLSPIDSLAPRSFAMHMIEHEMLMVIAAPLLVLSRPLEAWAFALPRNARHTLSACARVPALVRFFAAMTAPVSATIVHAIALWVWHAPVLFAAAIASEPLHVLQHLCFFASALAFWWAVFGGAARSPRPVSLACLFATMLQTSALGALITLAPSPWYASGGEARVFGLTPLADQQLGGLIMWLPGGAAYIVVALAIVAIWLAPPRVRGSFSDAARKRRSAASRFA
ncbi:MAG TPA: cytochrome c oxidase assembly protein [Casimicrobiaceae bacterium]|nr:cytochrome c oxidase assembly protein [Casimicrobiaceae bacterium]